MELIEKQWKHGVYKAYTNVEPELYEELAPGMRVLPAPFFYEKRLWFHLIKRYEPGEKIGFPEGGYEVRDEGGSVRSYELDQVIIHPAVIKHQKTLDKMKRKAEKEAAKRERKREKEQKRMEKNQGKRGRKPLSDEEKQLREQLKTTTIKSGKRGRPPMAPELKQLREQEKQKRLELNPERRRGRKPLDPEVKKQRELEKVNKPKYSKRGRPPKNK